jgi:hypothetical protein
MCNTNMETEYNPYIMCPKCGEMVMMKDGLWCLTGLNLDNMKESKYCLCATCGYWWKDVNGEIGIRQKWTMEDILAVLPEIEENKKYIDYANFRFLSTVIQIRNHERNCKKLFPGSQ